MAQYQNIVPNQLGQGAMSTLSTLYTVPAGTRTLLKDINIANTTTAAINATVYLVPNAGSAGTSNTLIPGISVPGNSILQWTGTQILPTSSTIQTLASSTGLTIVASGGEAT